MVKRITELKVKKKVKSLYPLTLGLSIKALSHITKTAQQISLKNCLPLVYNFLTQFA